jgi:hypothetical protein
MSSKKPVAPKVILSGNTIKIAYDPDTGSTNLLTASYFPGMVTGGWGDPHMYLRLKGTNKFLSKWGDNKAGASGKNEILYLYIRTSRDTISIYYTNNDYGIAKITTSIRVVHNNETFNFSNNAVRKFGPVRLSVARIPWGQNYYLNYEVDWDPIPNLRQIGGAVGIPLRRVAFGNGSAIDGRDGLTWDGYSFLGQPFGLSRTDFESGFQGQSAKAMNVIPGSFDYISLLNSEPSVDPSSFSPTMTDFLETLEDSTFDAGIVDDDNGDPVEAWDPEYEAAQPIFNRGNLPNYLVIQAVEEEVEVEGLNEAIAARIYQDILQQGSYTGDTSTDPNNPTGVDIFDSYNSYLMQQSHSHIIP